jgi:hypothetical protein
MKISKAAGALFKPSPNRLETKAQTTHSTARAIIDAEAASREVKTAKLRKARLEMEERALLDAPPPAPAKKKTRAAK